MKKELKEIDIEETNDTLEEKHSNKLITLLILIVIIIGGIICYSRFIGTKGLEVIENSIVDSELPGSFNGFKIVQFADIHYGQTTSINDIKKMVTKINELKPDIVIFTGDLFDNDIKVTEDDINKLKEELSKIDANLNKYAVKGDNDYSNESDYETVIRYAEFTILDNSNELIYLKDSTPIKIVGTTSLIKSDIDYNSAYNILGDEEQYFTILLTHEPNIINEIESYKTNILFTSNSLGGLINIPFVGGTFKFKGSDNYIKGYYKVNKTKMYVNSGIGTSNYNFRLFNKPSINLYRLYNY